MNELQRRDLYLGVLFKVAFLKSMLPLMTEDDMMAYYSSCYAIVHEKFDENDVRAIETLFKKFENEAVPNANTFPKD